MPKKILWNFLRVLPPGGSQIVIYISLSNIFLNIYDSSCMDACGTFKLKKYQCQESDWWWLRRDCYYTSLIFPQKCERGNNFALDLNVYVMYLKDIYNMYVAYIWTICITTIYTTSYKLNRHHLRMVCCRLQNRVIIMSYIASVHPSIPLKFPCKTSCCINHIQCMILVGATLKWMLESTIKWMLESTLIKVEDFSQG